jgi:hypothetical protein
MAALGGLLGFVEARPRAIGRRATNDAKRLECVRFIGALDSQNVR